MGQVSLRSRVLACLVLLGLLSAAACDRKARRDKAAAPDVNSSLPSGWKLTEDWTGSSLQVKDLSY